MFEVRIHGRGGQGVVTAAELLAAAAFADGRSAQEAEHGEVTAVSPIRHRVLVEEYLRPQTRLRHLFQPERRAEVNDGLQAIADRDIRRFNLLPGEET